MILNKIETIDFYFDLLCLALASEFYKTEKLIPKNV
jgi:hypothetical protein